MRYFVRESKALDPGMWRNDSSPHRLPEHHDVIRTPYGKIRQEQEIEALEFNYAGVHLTDSFELAAVYANGKASRDDPPVVIAIDRSALSPVPDIDAKNYASEVCDVLGQRSGEFNEILSDKEIDSSLKVKLIVDSLEEDRDYESDYSDEPDELIARKARGTVENVAAEYLKGISDSDKCLEEFRSLLNCNIPDVILINMANQFRVMKPIESDIVISIYQVALVNLNRFMSRYALSEMDDEELESDGITKIDDEFYDDDGRMYLDYEDIEYGYWTNKKLIYNSNKKNDTSLTYHGTSLSRAKLAFPEILV